MTFEQLSIFIAVAEREHLTKAAGFLGLTPSAVSASIRALEAHYNVRLFDRVGRGIELTRDGEVFLREARETVARAKAAQSVLAELGGLKTGKLDVQASQTIANYWLPHRLLSFKNEYPGIDVHLKDGNTATVAAAVLEGAAELGFIEGNIDEPALSSASVAIDRLVIAAATGSKAAMDRDASPELDLTRLKWILREPGSGTRAVFERELRSRSIDPARLDVLLILPSNEGVLNAVRGSEAVTAISGSVAAPFVEQGQLVLLDAEVTSRQFTILRHKERRLSAAAKAFEVLCRSPAEQFSSP
ncbi:LysR family transcriptional regulator [Rhizobium sp. CECT 9324]|uniref:LysR family transcriptional regulator n=1 Tax=Rhizobium sp. CECT 9324 TaxID=2845820 RepID=UPI001E580D4E|nr:LysR family transcriptional regulator [Rhizobium sp. CECT 9324]CAH0342337.1 HTH-type transcriptional regulator CysL [Rhizobium sp. CECT 9324]